MTDDEPFAEAMIRKYTEILRGERPVPGRTDSLEGVRNVLSGFIQNSPRAVERAVGVPTFRELKAALTSNAPAANRQVVAVQGGTLGGPGHDDSTDPPGGGTYVEPPAVFTENENASNEQPMRRRPMTDVKSELRQLSKELTVRYGVGQDHVPAVALNVDAEDRAAAARGHLDAIDEGGVPEGAAEPLQQFFAALGTITERVQAPGGEDERSFVNGLEHALNDLRGIEQEELTDDVGQAVRELRQALQQSEENVEVEVDLAGNASARRDLERKLAHSTPFDRDELEGRSRAELVKIARLAENSGGVEHVPPPKVF